MTIALLLGLLSTAEAAPSQQYWDVGATLGMPGGLNATGAYWMGHFGARATLGYGGYSSGASLSALYRHKEIRPQQASHSVGLIWGHTEIADGHATYLAVAYEMDLKRGFYMQAGLGLSPRSTVPLVPVLSLGWVKRMHTKAEPEPKKGPDKG